MKTLAVFALILFSSLISAADSEKKPEGLSQNGKPLVIRSEPRTEIFFRDLKDSAWIANDHMHNRFFAAFQDAMKKGQSLKFTTDPKTRQVTAVDGVIDPEAPEAEAAAGGQK